MVVTAHMETDTCAYDYPRTTSAPVGRITKTSPREVDPTGMAGSTTTLTTGGIAIATITTNLTASTRTNGKTSRGTKIEKTTKP